MGAISALKGYRTQFLYSLYRILKDYHKGYIFKPEGEYEDLDIQDENGNYLEIIQIKNKSETLVFSDLLSKKDSFFKRAIKLLDKQDNVVVKIISFGNVSNELVDKKKLSKKLIQKGFNINKVDKLLDNYESPEVINEVWLNEELIKLIKDIRSFSNPIITLELLIFWVYKSAEMQKKIKSKEIISTLDSIGTFLSEQKSFINQFGNTILPFSDKKINNTNEEILQNEFYYGVSAKYEHIIKELDVNRYEKINNIKEAFSDSNIVFIHGASGQGKSTLAYRYIHDFSDSNASYELKLSNDYNEASETINSLNALCKELRFPILVYIDVKPQDKYWNDLLKELSAKNNLNFLITIRQEDWNRATLGADYNFSDIELTFNKTEASFIYESLSNYKRDLKFTDFEESWLKFGSGGLLLEYVYLINQGDTLKARLKSQVYRLEEQEKISELETLKFVSLSDNYGAKISFKKIVTEVDINSTISNKITRHLEKEYLLKFSENKEYLTGLHPIRSKILCEILFDENDYVNKHEFVNKAVNLIDEKDLHTFLLNAFDEGYEIEKLQKVLSNCTFNSWTGNLNVLKALLWKGVHDFVFIKNNKPFSKLYNKYKSFWELVLPYDYSEVTEKDILSSLEIIPQNIIDEISEIKKEFSPKKDVFNYIKEWLHIKNKVSIILNTEKDIGSLGEFTFWIGYLQIDLNIELDNNQIIPFLDSRTSLNNFSVLLLGLQTIGYSNKFINSLKFKFKKRFFKEFNVLGFTETDEEVKCEYYINFLKFGQEEGENEDNIFHNRSIEIIELLRKSYPNKESYATQLVSPMLAQLEMPYDPSVKKIKKNYLPLDYLVQINNLVNNIFVYEFRPDSWEMYTSNILEKRKVYYELLEEIVKGFQEYFKKKDYKVFVKPLELIEINSRETERVKLPKNISDKWGYISESLKSNFLDERAQGKNLDNQVASIRKYKQFNKYGRDYFSKVENIFNQIQGNILSVHKIYSGEENIESYNPNILYSNLCDALSYNIRFQEEFNRHFSKYCESKKLKDISFKENKILETIFYCWNQFLNQGNRNISSKVYVNSANEFKSVKDNLTKRFKAERRKFISETGIGFNILINESTDKKLILTAEVISEQYLTSLLLARVFIQNTLHSGDFSAKSIILKENIESVIYIPLMYGMALNNKAFEIYTHNLGEDFDEDKMFSFFNPLNEIDNKITKTLEIDFWNKENDDIKNYERVMSDLATIYQFQLQLNAIKTESQKFDCNICKTGISDYNSDLNNFMENRKEETIESWKSIESLITDKKLYNQINMHLINYDLNELSSDIESAKDKLSEEYYSFAEIAIEKEFDEIISE
jgi:hypothetical protein